jgi:hypothetical protein
MTYDPDFDTPIEREWWILMRNVTKYDLELVLSKHKVNDTIKILIEIKEDDHIIYIDNDLEESTDPYYRTVRFLKKYLEVEYL